jgi:hypothetical protein
MSPHANTFCATALAFVCMIGGWSARTHAEQTDPEIVEVQLTQQIITNAIMLTHQQQDLYRALSTQTEASPNGQLEDSVVNATMARSRALVTHLGFANWEAYVAVNATIQKYQFGIDPKTGKYTDKSAAYRAEAEARMPKTLAVMPPADRVAMERALRRALETNMNYLPPKFPANPALVEQNYEALMAPLKQAQGN